MKVYIPAIPKFDLDRRRMFLLCRPFFKDGIWQNDISTQMEWGLSKNKFNYVDRIEDAEIMLLPFSVNDYFDRGLKAILEKYNLQCTMFGIKAYAFIAGDWGLAFPEFEHITYFRMGGFRSQLSARNQGFPAALSDHYRRLYKSEEIEVREKKLKPVIGFCGHATLAPMKRLKENLKFIKENFKRAIRNPFRGDWEPLFASAYQRALLLKYLEKTANIETNFIYRNKYRGGYKTAEELEATTLEYYENIRTSDYVVCIRGGGNFSIRLYETLMMGRIPIFVNTDCILPKEEIIEWKKHLVWVEWHDRSRIAEILIDFHYEIHADDFIKMQLANRELWKNQLSINGSLNELI